MIIFLTIIYFKLLLTKYVILQNIDDYSAFMGNIIVADKDGNKIGEMNNRNRDYSFNDLLNVLPVVIHPATFFRAETLKQTKEFDRNVHYIMDYDIFLKCSLIKPIRSINTYVSALRRHDTSKACSEDYWKFSYEFFKSKKKIRGEVF